MDLAIGSTYQNKNGDKIRVLDICDNLDNKPKVVLYKKNKGKKVLQSFQDVLMETTHLEMTEGLSFSHFKMC